MNEKDPSQNLSTQKVLLGGHQPGWNDPPKWAYPGVQSSSTTPTKRLLNKRVAFPLAPTGATDNLSTSEISSKATNMPPVVQSPINLTTVPCLPLLSSSDKETNLERGDVELDKVQALNDSLANFQAVIDEHISEKNTTEDVQKRLHLMKDAWLNDKLNRSIHQQILELSNALKEGNIDKADRIHVALMIQDASLCGSWIPGIRRVILELKTKFKSSNDTQQPQDSQPHLLPVKVGEAN